MKRLLLFALLASVSPVVAQTEVRCSEACVCNPCECTAQECSPACVEACAKDKACTTCTNECACPAQAE